MKKFTVPLIIIAACALALIAAFAFVDSVIRWLLLLLGVAVLVIGCVIIANKRSKPAPPVSAQYEYAAKAAVMSAPELQLYRILLRVCGNRISVFPQVALISLVDKTTHASYRNELFRVVDFALCDVRTSKPLLVVELNDASHNRAERKVRDEKVRCILDRAGLPLVALSLAELSDERALVKKLQTALDS